MLAALQLIAIAQASSTLPRTQESIVFTAEAIAQEETAEVSLEEKIKAGDTSTTTIKAFIEEEAVRLGVDPKLATKTANCESGYQYDIKNPKSTAQGTFQFIDSTWLTTLERMGLPTTTPKTDAVIGVKAGVWLLKEDGAKAHWFPSEFCWSSSVAKE